MADSIESQLLLHEVNAIRAKGCQCGDEYYPPVKRIRWNDNLRDIAQSHADDMRENNYFSHYDKDNQDIGERINEKKYRWVVIGENIAVGHLSNQHVMQGWLASEEHCQMIMEPLVREMGAGRSGRYWVQSFGSRYRDLKSKSINALVNH